MLSIIPKILNVESVKLSRESLDYSHIPDDSNDFDNGEEKLGFAISFDTKQVDGHNYYEKNCDKNGMIVSCPVPEIDSN